MSRILSYFQERKGALIDGLRQMVEIESPTLEPQRVNAMGEHVKERLRSLGASVEVDTQTERGHNVIGRFGDPAMGDPVLMIGHTDTVWKVGTLEERPFRVDGNRAFGPGAADMKSGLIIMLAVLEAINDLQLPLPRPLTLIFNSDEEMQSLYSRELIEKEARKSFCSLAFEGTRDLNAFTTSRKASGRFTVRAKGKSAHAASGLREGVNAIEELAHQVTEVQALTDFGTGTTINVGTIAGGDRPNIIPDWAEMVLSVRAVTTGEMGRIEQVLRSLEPHLAGAEISVSGGFHRPPLEETEASKRLLERLREVASEFGIDARGELGGGAGDANLTSAVGCPSIDSMGAVGFGAHSVDEHILIDELPARAAVATRFITSL